MKKTVVVLTSIFALLLSACTAIFTPTPDTGPTVDTAGTSDALFKTAVAQTLTAQPTLPPVSVTDTATLPIESPVLSFTDTPIATFTPIPNLTTTPATATSGSAIATISPVTFTATLATGQLTASPTLGIRKYGTLPPAVPFNRITLSNKAKAEAYISLQVTMKDGKFSIIEYPVEGTIKIEAPVGSYLYVAWVGGRKMVGNFKLNHDDELLITLYKDRVVIK
ncbi:MAG: hypothetical protein EHM33_01465 [Chloroflexi bacterium]|nr:MAG: hypothetical protein EHM33_01465 [Chloroflexota bacterium]